MKARSKELLDCAVTSIRGDTPFVHRLPFQLCPPLSPHPHVDVHPEAWPLSCWPLTMCALCDSDSHEDWDDAGLIARLAKFEEHSGVEKATLVRAALTAALDCYERQGRIAFPLVIADSSQYRKGKGG